MVIFVSISLSLHLKEFIDTEWIGSIDEHKSMGGFVIFLGDNLIYLASKKQWIVDYLLRESEYKALVDELAEVTWTKSLIFCIWCSPF